MLTCALLLAFFPQVTSPSKANGTSKLVLGCGHWEPSFDHDLTGFPPLLPKFNAAHMCLIPKGPHRGKIMAWDIHPDSTFPEWKQRWAIVDPAAQGGPTYENYELTMPTNEGDLFCAGLAWTSAGDLLVVGGTSQYPALVAQPARAPRSPGGNPVGKCPTGAQNCCGNGGVRGQASLTGGGCAGGCGCGCEGLTGGGYLGGKLTYLWDPSGPIASGNDGWYRQPDMAIDRWYPTAVQRGDGTLLVAGGVTGSEHALDSGDSYEVFVLSGTNPPAGTWQQGPAGQLYPGPDNPVSTLYIYPRLHALATGQIFLAGMSSHARYLDHTNAPGVWVKGKNSTFDARIYGTTMLMPYVPDGSGNYLDEVLVLGGRGLISRRAWRLDGVTKSRTFVSTASVDISFPTAINNGWFAGPPLLRKRWHANGVLLADGSVMVIGGNAGKTNDLDPVFNAELFDGTSWTELPPQDTKRTYHSTALLLPDGRVLSAGGNSATQDYQIFVPSYLCSGDPRPVVTVAPSVMGYYAESPVVHTIGFEPLPLGHSVARAVLISPGAVTHHTDCNQRYVQLITDSVSSDHIDVRAPATRNLVPPGYYMLFLLTDAGVPSVASWVKVQ